MTEMLERFKSQFVVERFLGDSWLFWEEFKSECVVCGITMGVFGVATLILWSAAMWLEGVLVLLVAVWIVHILMWPYIMLYRRAFRYM